MKQIRLKHEIYIIDNCGDFGSCPYWSHDDCRCGYDWGILSTHDGFPEDCPLEDYQEGSK